MAERDILAISKKIDEEKEYLNFLSLQIWENPELNHEEKLAHKLLTEALQKYGFDVQAHYFLSTAFRAEFCQKGGPGPTIAVLCEYDALPDIGHACGHNLIAEAGMAAGMAVKAAMEANPSIHGKIVVLGTLAEEGGFGKVTLIEKGAFKDIDVALMVHPAGIGIVSLNSLCLTQVSVTYLGKESHASAYPWEGQNALDAAVSCYNNISLLRQQIKPTCRIHGIITNGGAAPNIIPGETELKFDIRAPTITELVALKERVTRCFESAALATGCEVKINFPQNIYENIKSNKVLASIFKEHGEKFGLKFDDNDSPNDEITSGSTDMGNVSNVVPSIHPLYNIGGENANHTKGFTSQAATDEAQIATLAAAKAMAVVAIKLMKDPELLQSAKDNFHKDSIKEKSS